MAASLDSARRVDLQEGTGTWMWWFPSGGGQEAESHVPICGDRARQHQQEFPRFLPFSGQSLCWVVLQ